MTNATPSKDATGSSNAATGRTISKKKSQPTPSSNGHVINGVFCPNLSDREPEPPQMYKGMTLLRTTGYPLPGESV